MKSVLATGQKVTDPVKGNGTGIPRKGLTVTTSLLKVPLESPRTLDREGIVFGALWKGTFGRDLPDRNLAGWDVRRECPWILLCIASPESFKMATVGSQRQEIESSQRPEQDITGKDSSATSRSAPVEDL